jgi:hypothetical protein
MFSTEVEYEKVGSISDDDAGTGGDFSICGFNKVRAQYDKVFQAGGVSDRFYDCKDWRVGRHRPHEEEASPP